MFCCLAFAQNSDSHNGNWWLKLDSPSKLMYVIGYTDGKCTGEVRALLAVHLTEEQTKDVPRCTWPKETTYGQISDSLDQFYKDYRNRLILTDDALDYTKARIEGKPESPNELNKLREMAARDSESVK